VEPTVEGALPSARKGVAAAASGGAFVVLFGGCAANEQGEDVYMNDLHLIEVQGLTTVRSGQQETSGAVPAPRAGALLQEQSEGRLLLYGGTGADGKPLGDAWVLDVATLTWECLYDGVGPEVGAHLHMLSTCPSIGWGRASDELLAACSRFGARLINLCC